jgi:hypothetical protein
MKMYKTLSKTLLLLTVFGFITLSCSKNKTYSITVGVFEQDSLGNYNSTGNDIVLDSDMECQTWSRTAQADSHSASSHLHYNAAAGVSYDSDAVSFTWTEYGPELDQAAIESTCSAGVDGVTKTVNDQTYYQDKPTVYLKIIDVVEN